MVTSIRNAIVVVCAVGFAGFAGAVSAEAETPARTPAADTDVVQMLKRMTDDLGGLQSFAMHTENSYEDGSERDLFRYDMLISGLQIGVAFTF